MSRLHVNIPHELPQEEAIDRIKNMLGELKESQKEMITNVKEEWVGNTGHFSFTAKSFDLSGMMVVGPASVDIKANLPFALSFFKGQISKVIEERAAKLLS